MAGNSLRLDIEIEIFSRENPEREGLSMDIRRSGGALFIKQAEQ